MRKLLLATTLILSSTAMAQDYQPFELQPFVWNPQTLQQSVIQSELPSIINLNDQIPDMPAENTDLTIDVNPQPVVIPPVEIQPIVEPPLTQNIEGSLFQDPDSFGGGNIATTPEPTPAPKPERIPWPEPGYNCCWPQNIEGSLFVDPDAFGGGN